jgi:hypothetical protein
VQDEVKKADEEKAKAKSGFQRGYGGVHGHESSGNLSFASAEACALRFVQKLRLQLHAALLRVFVYLSQKLSASRVPFRVSVLAC